MIVFVEVELKQPVIGIEKVEEVHGFLQPCNNLNSLIAISTEKLHLSPALPLAKLMFFEL